MITFFWEKKTETWNSWVGEVIVLFSITAALELFSANINLILRQGRPLYTFSRGQELAFYKIENWKNRQLCVAVTVFHCDARLRAQNWAEWCSIIKTEGLILLMQESQQHTSLYKPKQAVRFHSHTGYFHRQTTTTWLIRYLHMHGPICSPVVIIRGIALHINLHSCVTLLNIR